MLKKEAKRGYYAASAASQLATPLPLPADTAPAAPAQLARRRQQSQENCAIGKNTETCEVLRKLLGKSSWETHRDAKIWKKLEMAELEKCWSL